MIYYLQDPSDNMIKIGTAISVIRRQKQLEYRHGTLNLLGVHAGSRDLERCIHDRFDELRAEGTEWFEAGPDLLEWIRTVPHAWSIQDEADPDYDQDYSVVSHGEFLQWSRRLCEHLGGVELSTLAARAIVHYGEHMGFPETFTLDSEKRNKERPPLPGEPMPLESAENEELSGETPARKDREMATVSVQSFGETDEMDWDWV